MKGEHMEHFL